jgi:hypothetical protein
MRGVRTGAGGNTVADGDMAALREPTADLGKTTAPGES